MTIIAYHPGSLVKLAVAVVFVFGAGTAHARNLIRNGGFEMPSTPAGTYTTYGAGQAIGAGWTVVGNGNVATVNAYNEGGVVWVAHKGSAFVDLTGTCDCGANSGVAQTVKTVVGTTYSLTFWVGNTYIPGQGLSSTVDVYAGTNLLLAAKNTKGEGSSKEVWKKFTTHFVATSTTTAVSFVNADPSGDEQNGVDDVSLVAE
jgi:hypothetical protein